MQTGIAEVREDKAGSNLFSVSQYWRIFHSVTVNNTNVTISPNNKLKLTKDYLRDETRQLIFLQKVAEAR